MYVTLKKHYFHIVKTFEKPDRVFTASAVKHKVYLLLLLQNFNVAKQSHKAESYLWQIISGKQVGA